jgi:hypothetical protein
MMVVTEGAGGPRELLTGLNASGVGTTTPAWDYGVYGMMTTSTDGGWDVTVPGRTLARPYTLFGVCTPRSTTGVGGITKVGTSSGGSWIYRSVTGFSGYTETASQVWVGTGDGVITSGNTYAVVACDDGTTPRMVVKDLTSGTVYRDTAATTRSVSATITTFGIGTTGYSEDWNGDLYLGGWASRAWTLDEMYTWIANPFCLLHNQRRPITVYTQQGSPGMRLWTFVPGMSVTGRGW